MFRTQLKNRKLYLDRLAAFQDTDLIKVITGIRRCGKSSLLRLMAELLLRNGVQAQQIIEINFESMRFSGMDAIKLYQYISDIIVPEQRTYLFFDEIQLVDDWQKAINSFRVDYNCDIYITGSNAFLLSSELSTFLSGRYVEIRMLPLSFREFLDFLGYKVERLHLLNGIESTRIYHASGEQMDTRELFGAYIRFGGMPSIIDTGLEMDKVAAVLDGIYSTVVVRDILEHGRRREQRAVTDALLLRKLVMFLADNIGSNVSANSISNTLINEKLIDNKPEMRTVQTYIDALTEAYIFYEIKRFDIRGKDYLRTLGKYYMVDNGLRNYLLGFRGGDRGHLLENTVYFELLRRGYNIAVGKIDNKEIDFIATKTDQKIYIQVTESISSEETKNRELSPLFAVRDNYEKIVLVLEKPLFNDINGIKIISVIDFLLEDI